MTEDLARATILVHGRVQGVGFREYALRVAGAIKGIVSNTDDGCVACDVEGSRAAIEELISYLQVGPPLAQVDSVDVTWHDPSGTYTSFQAR